MGYVWENEWFTMDEPIKNMLLQSLVIIFHILSFTNFEGVVAVGEDDGGQLQLVVQEVTTVEMGDWNFVLTPERQRTRQLCEVQAI